MMMPWTPADGTRAAHCDRQNLGTSRWQLAIKGYLNSRRWWKGQFLPMGSNGSTHPAIVDAIAEF
jgi:hypothetical protein